MTRAQQVLVYAFLALQVLSVLLSAGALWQARRAWRSSERVRASVGGIKKELSDPAEGLSVNLRRARLQLSNIIKMLVAAGFKPKRAGWEDDLDATQQREPPNDMSWWRPKR
jgi:hypothetical protein